MTAIAAIAISYLLGSIPTAAIAGRIRGVDLRKKGSGNLGATNALRVLGPSIGVPVLAVDVAKGALAVLAVAALPGAAAQLGPGGIRLACGLAAIAGHIAPVFAGFRGGKGVATACGVFLAMAPLAAAACVGLWLALVLLTRYVSVGSIAAAAALPFAVLIETRLRNIPQPLPLIAVAAVVAIFVVARHRPNIRRLVVGTENKFSFTREKS
ncbi:MAG: glycerol-3-phosphate 1-O-acyltransferase PlsY [Candidatus Eisenbacteria bacterium]|nr:glycerol-3-phosphate 1-O-acyltransferase PlsY [Candidatus Eisenbacteria bacterium]